MRKDCCGKQVTPGLRSTLLDLRVPARSLDSMVPRQVVAVSVTIRFQIVFIVLVIVRDQIGKRETIVAGHIVDAGMRASPRPIEQVGRAGEPQCEITELLLMPEPE